MDYADAIRRQAEDAPRAALPAVTAALWRAFAEGHVTEAEAEALSALIEVRQVKSETVSHSPQVGNADVIPAAVGSSRRAVGSRPRTDASMERRRRWAASGRLPPGLAARFTLAEQAVLALIAAETARRGDCRLAIERMAAEAGVSRSTVKNALREARKFGLITIEERRIASFRNDTNVVRVVSPEWQAWLRLTRREARLGRRGALAFQRKGGGVKSSTSTPTQISTQGKTRTEGLTSRLHARAKASSEGTSRIAGA